MENLEKLVKTREYGKCNDFADVGEQIVERSLPSVRISPENGHAKVVKGRNDFLAIIPPQTHPEFCSWRYALLTILGQSDRSSD